MSDKNIKLFIDDIRKCPDGWVPVKTVQEAITFLHFYRDRIKAISFDHDISIPVVVGGEWKNTPSPETFTAVAYYVVALAEATDNFEWGCVVHSSNPEGRAKIKTILMSGGIDCKDVPLPIEKRTDFSTEKGVF
jgi:hypothetical protein